MAKRKSPPKKATKKAVQDDVIIEGIAEEIDPSSIKSQKAQTKAKINPSPSDKVKQHSSRPALLLSLIALLFGITGATLGGLAYVSSINEPDQYLQEDAVTRLIDARLHNALAPLHEDIALLKSSFDDVSSNQNNISVAEDLSTLAADIDRLNVALKTLENTQTKSSSADGALAEHDHEHIHDNYVSLDDLEQRITILRQDIDALMAAQSAPMSDDVTSPDTDQSTENQGWWNAVLRTFSITKIDTPTKESE